MNVDLSHISTLSFLSIDAESSKRIEKDLAEILSLVDSMEVIDTHDIEPMTHPHDGFQRIRDDIVTEVVDLEENQKAAPKTNRGFYLVPKVIES